MCIRLDLVLVLLLLPSVSRAQSFPLGSGFTWEKVGDRPLDIRGLAFDAAGTLWADGQPLYYLDLSAGWPGTWVELNDDIYAPYILPLGPAGALGRADTVVVSNFDIYRTTDAGATWSEVSPFVSRMGLVEVPSGPLAGWLLAVLDIGVAASEDRGATWREAEMQTGVSWNPNAAVIGLPSGRVLAGGPNGITVSDDSAHTFQPSSFWEYLRYGARHFLVVERPEGGQRILAVTSDQTRPNYRFHASDDDGETWFELGDVIDPDTGGSDSGEALFPLGGSKALLVMKSGSVQVTTDAGETWQAVGRLLDEPEMSSITSVALDAERRLYVSVSRAGLESEWVYRTTAPVVVANEPASVPEEHGIGLEVRPNPASRVLHVEAPGAGEAVVYDVLGREVLRIRLGGITEADVSSLAPGVYVVRAGGQAAVVTVRR